MLVPAKPQYASVRQGTRIDSLGHKTIEKSAINPVYKPMVAALAECWGA